MSDNISLNNLMDEQAAANVLAIKVSTLRKWRVEGKGPAFLKIGAAVRYMPSDIADFIDAARHSNTAESM